MKEIAAMNKILWIETSLKKINHDRAPSWVKKECGKIEDNLTSLKAILELPQLPGSGNGSQSRQTQQRRQET